jgi:hypothetical protein
MTYTYEQIVEQYKRLPQDIKEAVDLLDPAGAIGQIGQKYVLHIDQIGILADQVAMVIIGFSRPENFVTNIIARIGLDRAVAEGIAREVNEQIFLKIRESLQELHQDGPDNYGVDPVRDREGSQRPSVSNGVETIPDPRPAMADQPATVNLPNREEVIDGIENPAKTPEESVFEQKMGKLFRIPREEVDLDPYLEKPGK